MDDPCDTFLVLVEYRDGSLNLIASAREVSKMDVSAEGGTGCEEAEDEKERNRPPVFPGVGMPEVRGLPGVVAISSK